MKKKILLLSLLSSFLIVGAMVGAAAYLENDLKLNVEANDKLIARWNKGEVYIQGQDKNNHIAVSYVDYVFENTDPVQKISEVKLSGGAKIGSIKYQAGYYSDGFGSEVHFTNKMYIDNPYNKISFEVGKEPSFIRISNWDASQSNSLKLTYLCINGDKTQVNNYPALEPGYYVTGNEGVSSRGETWTPYSAIPCSTAKNNELNYTLKAGTRFKIVWYDGKAFNDKTPTRIESNVNDAMKNGIIYQEPNGDYFVAKTSNIIIILGGDDQNKTMKFLSTDKKDIETTIVRLMIEGVTTNYETSTMRFYQNPGIANYYHIEGIYIPQNTHISAAYGSGTGAGTKFGYQVINEAGTYNLTARYLPNLNRWELNPGKPISVK